MGSAISTPTYQAQNSNIANDGSATSPRGWASAGDANYTFTSTGPMRVRVASPSAARTVTLPTTGIKAGAEFELLVTGATETNYVVLNSSGANEVDRIGGSGKILVVALQDTPTTAAHWQVVDVWEKATGTYDLTVGVGTGATVNTGKSINITRANKQISLQGSGGITTGTGASATLSTASGALPVRFRPLDIAMVSSRGYENGVPISVPAVVFIETNGTINIAKSSAWVSSTAATGLIYWTLAYPI